jgi:4-hydroxy-tetrahydrodipicolinate synthase
MFQGSMVALVTPMRADGALEWDALGGLVEWHIDPGTAGLVAVGTTGESPTLDMGEHLEVIRRVVDMANKRIPVIAGTGSNSTSEALELTQGANHA